MSYHIAFKGWSNPRRESLDGYNAWDYLSGTPRTFDTRSEAQSWLRAHQKGADQYRVKALFKIAKGPVRNPSRKRKAATRRRNPGSKTISLRNFTGKVKLNPDKTVDVLGVGKRGVKKRAVSKRRVTRRRR